MASAEEAWALAARATCAYMHRQEKQGSHQEIQVGISVREIWASERVNYMAIGMRNKYPRDSSPVAKRNRGSTKRNIVGLCKRTRPLTRETETLSRETGASVREQWLQKEK